LALTANIFQKGSKYEAIEKIKVAILSHKNYACESN